MGQRFKELFLDSFVAERPLFKRGVDNEMRLISAQDPEGRMQIMDRVVIDGEEYNYGHGVSNLQFSGVRLSGEDTLRDLFA